MSSALSNVNGNVSILAQQISIARDGLVLAQVALVTAQNASASSAFQIQSLSAQVDNHLRSLNQSLEQSIAATALAGELAISSVTANVVAVAKSVEDSIRAVNSSAFAMAAAFAASLNAHQYPILPLYPLTVSGPDQPFDVTTGTLFSIQAGNGTVSTEFVPNCNDHIGHFLWVVNLDTASHRVNCFNEADPTVALHQQVQVICMHVSVSSSCLVTLIT